MTHPQAIKYVSALCVSFVSLSASAEYDLRLDEEELDMLRKINEIDKKEDEGLKRLMEAKKADGVFMRLAAYNKPCYLMVFGLIGAAVNGSIQPFVGITFGKLMTIMTTPEDWATLIANSLNMTRKEWFSQELNFWVIALAILAVINMFSAFG